METIASGALKKICAPSITAIPCRRLINNFLIDAGLRTAPSRAHER